MQITQEGDRVHVRLVHKIPHGWDTLADFRIDASEYEEFKQHVKSRLDAFTPLLPKKIKE